MPISDCDVRDPRIRRTRQLLQAALKKLLGQKRLDEISVQDIADEATVNRATFYDHYNDKYDLLNAMAATGFHQLLHERQVIYDGTCMRAISAIIQAVCDYLLLLHGESGSESKSEPFEPLMEAAMVRAVRRVLEGPRAGSQSDHSRLDPLDPLTASAVSWAVYGAAKEWFYSVDRVPVDDAVSAISRLVLPMLEGSTRQVHAVVGA